MDGTRGLISFSRGSRSWSRMMHQTRRLGVGRSPVWLLLPVGLQRHYGNRNIIPTALRGDRAG